MSNEKHDHEYVRATIENEGLWYAVQCYMSGDSIADPVLAKLWDAASDALDAIEDYLRKGPTV